MTNENIRDCKHCKYYVLHDKTVNLPPTYPCEACEREFERRRTRQMTDREKAIVMAYTGTVMLAGDKFNIFHKYVEELMGRPIYTHEIGFLADEIKEKAKNDFIKLCKNERQPRMGRWIRKTKVDAYDIAGVKTWGIKCQCNRCGFTTIVIEDFGYYKYCPNCGTDMVQSEGEK